MKRIDQAEWMEVYGQHALWLETSGEEGEKLVLNDKDLREINASESDLTDADLDGCNISSAKFDHCTFVRTSMKKIVADETDFEASTFDEVDMSDAILTGTDFREAKFEDVNLQSANLDGAYLKDAEFDRADFREASLQKADFRECEIDKTDFRKANLKEADFEKSIIHIGDFREADLWGADFTYTKIYSSDFDDSNIESVKFRRAECDSCDFSNAQGDPTGHPRCDEDCKLAGTVMHPMYEPTQRDVENYTGIGVWSFRHDSVDYAAIDDGNGNMSIATEASYEAAAATLYLHNDANDAYEDFWTTLEYVDDPIVRYAAYEEHNILRNIDNAGMVVKCGAGCVDQAMAIAEEENLDVVVYDGNEPMVVYDGSVPMPVFRERQFSLKPDEVLLLGKADDVKTLSESLAESNVETKPVTSYGRSRGAVAELKRVTEPMKVAAFKRTFPSAFEAVKKSIVTQTIEPPAVQALIDKFGLTWNVSQTKWEHDLQRLSPKPNDVLQFNVDIAALTRDPEILKALNAIRSTSYQSLHPVVRMGPMMTVGWVRYADFPDKSVLLIEEVQSDLPTVRKASSEDTDFKRQLEEKGGKEAIEKALNIMKPFMDRFYEDALAAIFDLAEEIGRKRVEMLTYKSKKEMGSPMNVYEKLPKRMGMRKTEDVKSLAAGKELQTNDGYDNTLRVKVEEVWAIQLAAPNPTKRRKPTKRKFARKQTWSRKSGFGQ